ncbi:MAG: DUF58 domain-containing protein [Planctomycetota bacterium]|jgi:uncharacterized protein (DUF58 family)
MRPTTFCVLVFAAGIAVALLSAILSERLWTLWFAYLGLSLIACAADVLFGLRPKRLMIGTNAPDTIYIGDEGRLEVRLRAPRRVLRPIELLVDLGENLEPQPLVPVAIPASGRGRGEFALKPLRRGTVTVIALWLRWAGPFGLMRRQVRLDLDHRIAVLPNVGAVRQAALRFFSTREFLSGLKVEHYIGDGSEFESLKEYVPGLDSRALNWKASARHRKLLVELYRAERNHQIVLALDTGHLMSEPMEGIPKLDHAINAGLMLSYACVRTGDRAGWFCFDEKVRAFSEPLGGTYGFNQIQRFTADIDYSQSETNFTLGLASLSVKLKRRSLIVLLTDFVDTITAELMMENLQRLARRHLVLFVTLRDPTLPELARRRPDDLDDLYRAVVSAEFVRERDVVLKRLQRMGVHCIDAPPGLVTTSLLNRYLEIKRRELV